MAMAEIFDDLTFRARQNGMEPSLKELPRNWGLASRLLSCVQPKWRFTL